MLQVQYRMPKDIMGFSNEWFYKGKLQAAENTEFHAFTEEEPVLEWIDTAGSGFSDQVNEESLSTFNPEEARFACTYLNDTLKRIGFAHFKQKKLVHWLDCALFCASQDAQTFDFRYV